MWSSTVRGRPQSELQRKPVQWWAGAEISASAPSGERMSERRRLEENSFFQFNLRHNGFIENCAG